MSEEHIKEIANKAD